MKIDADRLIKNAPTEFNNTLKRSYLVIKLVSFQECKDGSIYTKSINSWVLGAYAYNPSYSGGADQED
jgi:hypothetical protein